jgi:hypothetical protein
VIVVPDPRAGGDGGPPSVTRAARSAAAADPSVHPLSALVVGAALLGHRGRTRVLIGTLVRPA